MTNDSPVALITGASSGIGRAAALAFAERGYRVVLAARNREAAEEALADIRAAGGEGAYAPTDVTCASDVEAAVGLAVERFGRLDCAFNNAGIEGAFRKVADLSEEEFDAVMDVNAKGVWLCMKYELLQLERQGGHGAIVNMSSVNALKGALESAAYCASKAAVLGLTRAAAVDYGHTEIRINALVAGAFRTPMLARVAAHVSPDEVDATLDSFAQGIPTGRLGDPAEAARAVVWLCSDEASYVHGSCFAVDGGLSAI